MIFLANYSKNVQTLLVLSQFGCVLSISALKKVFGSFPEHIISHKDEIMQKLHKIIPKYTIFRLVGAFESKYAPLGAKSAFRPSKCKKMVLNYPKLKGFVKIMR